MFQNNVFTFDTIVGVSEQSPGSRANIMLFAIYNKCAHVCLFCFMTFASITLLQMVIVKDG